MKKRLSFISNSSSQSFIIKSYNTTKTINEIKEYIFDILKSSKCYSLKQIKESVDVCYYKDILEQEDGETLKDIIDSWYIDYKKIKIQPNDIIVYIDDNFWPCDFDNDDTGWYKLSQVFKEFNISVVSKRWSMHMG